MYLWQCPHGIMVKAMDCGIMVSELAAMFTVGQIPLGKV